MKKSPILPDEFRDLEPFAEEFALPTRDARFHHRVKCSMDKIRAFYDAVSLRADAAVAYLDRVALDQLPVSDYPLLHLMLAYVDASRVIEIMGAPDVHSGFDADRLHIIDVAVL